MTIDTTHYASDSNVEGKYIPRSYQFERDMDVPRIAQRNDTIEFDETANDHIIGIDLEDTEALERMIDSFLKVQRERLEILEKYSMGDNVNILDGRRRIEEEKSDYRVRHNWGGYISSFITGYVIGNKVTITGNDETVDAINWSNDIDTLNYELAYDTSRYGRAFELHFRDEHNTDRIVLIDPKEMFVIRDHTVERNLIGAVYCPVYEGKMFVTLYTDSEVITYHPCNSTKVELREQERRAHFYKDVPVVEWWNNRFRKGDFESEISIMDAYDAAQSDTANYMSDLNDALLVINGDLNSAGITAQDALMMKRANMLLLESGLDAQGKQTNLSANYIYKQYDVAGTEAYKSRLVNDIYTLANVPNLEDDRFYSGNSGIALQYKMIGLEQIRSTKESFYTRALRRRYELIENVHRSLYDTAIVASELSFVFHPNIPKDVWAEIQAYMQAGGEISQETLREYTSFTDHAKEEARIDEEHINPASTDIERAFWGGLTNADQGTSV